MELHFKTKDHPEANGKTAVRGDEAWNVHMPLETGDTLFIHMGRSGRDLLFGMLIAECMDSGEPEPEPRKLAREKLLLLAIKVREKVNAEEWDLISEMLDLLKEAHQ